MPATYSGAWSAQEVRSFLEDSVIPMRLACVGSDGFPHVVSVWYRYRDDFLQCVTHRDSHLAGMLWRNEKVGFEVAPNDPPYHGVRGRGSATVATLGDNPALDELLEKYLGGRESRVANWLLSRKEEELLVTIRPHRLFSWDYRERMADVAAGQ